MNPVFADTGYFIAVLSPTDTLHAKATALTGQIASRQIVTTEMVLAEFLNEFAGRGQHLRMAAVRFVVGLQAQRLARIIPQTSDLFTDALALYSQRPDKRWSLTDCASMVVCRQEGIVEVLAHEASWPARSPA